MKLALRLFVAAAGLALFGWFVHRAGVGEIARALGTLGWSAPLVLLPFGLVYLLDTLAWRFAFGREGTHGVGFGTLFRIRWAGESVNVVLPLAYIGGEAAKVHLLRTRGLPTVQSASSVVAGKTAQVLAQVVFIALGALAGAANLPPKSPARLGMFAITTAALGIVTLLLLLQRKGMFTTLALLAGGLRLGLRNAPAKMESLRRLDERIFDFYRHDRRSFIVSTLIYLAGWMADTLEIFFASYLLGMPLDWTQALAVEAFITVAKALGIFVPAALGVQESGLVFLFYLFNLPPALGASYAIIRRGRDLVFALIGGALLYAEGLPLRPQEAPA
jgi:putative membrane protein